MAFKVASRQNLPGRYHLPRVIKPFSSSSHRKRKGRNQNISLPICPRKGLSQKFREIRKFCSRLLFLISMLSDSFGFQRCAVRKGGITEERERGLIPASFLSALPNKSPTGLLLSFT